MQDGVEEVVEIEIAVQNSYQFSKSISIDEVKDIQITFKEDIKVLFQYLFSFLSK